MSDERETLRFQVQRDGKNFVVRRFKTLAEGIYYKFPASLQSKDQHTKLFAYPAIVAAERDCAKDKNYRHIAVKMLETEVALYLDEARNPIFKDVTLEEDENQTEKMRPATGEAQQKPPDTAQELLLQKVNELENKLKETQTTSQAEVEKKFALNLFDGADPATDWITKFENECSRFNIGDANVDKRVELLGRLMKPESPAKNWFDINLSLNGHSGIWGSWRTAFTKVFAVKNWKPVREAHYLKYRNGSLVDYCLAKEKKLLNADPEAAAISRINAIVMGLPEFVQDQLPRGDLKEVNDLLAKLAALPEPFANKGRAEQKKSEGAEPCPYCKSKGFKKRFHRLEDCRTKRRDEENEKAPKKSKPKVNLLEQSSTEDSSDDEKQEIASSLN